MSSYSQNIKPETTEVMPKTVPDTVNQNTQNSKALKSKVTYKSTDSLQIDVSNKKVYLYGNAEVYYEDITLKAAYIEIDFENNLMYSKGLPDSSGTIIGNPVFAEKSQTFKAKEITYNFKTKKGKISNVFTNQDQGYIHGETIKKVSDDEFFIKNGKYTTCQNEDPHFYIAATKLKVVNKDKIITGPAYLVIADIPTPLAIPFGFFPNSPKKTSGILIPTYGETVTQGFFFENGGYYFALNDYLDLTLRGSIYTRGSWRTSSQLRYSNRYKYTGDFKLDYSNRKFGVLNTSSFSQVKDINIKWNHSQDSKARPTSSFSASVDAGSSTYLANNTFAADNFLSAVMQSTIAYRKNWTNKPYSFSANLRHSQNIREKTISLTLPELYFGVNRLYPFRNKTNITSTKWYKNVYENTSVGYTANFTNQINTFDSLLFTTAALNDFKNGLRHTIPINTSFKMLNYLTVSPSFNYTENWYNKTTEQYYSKADSMLIVNNKNIGFERVYNYNFSTSVSTTIYGMYSFKSKRLKAIRHVMQPNVSFNFKPDFSEDKWGFYDTYKDANGKIIRYSKFSDGIYGGVSPGRSESIGLGLNNNLEMKVRSKKDTITGFTKIKILESLNFSTSYNYAADSLKLSPISINGRTTIAKKLNINFSSTLDPYILNKTNTSRINAFRFNEDGKLGRFTNAYLALGYSMESKPTNGKALKSEDLDRLSYPYSNYIDFNIPWRLSINYNVNYSKPTTAKSITQSLTFNGDISLTQNWKVSFSSGYDFKTKDVTYTTFNIHRDLHCWEMSMNWIPFGTRQSYNFTINVKSSVLQDLKLNRRREWYDN